MSEAAPAVSFDPSVVHVLEHPLAAALLTQARDRDTPPQAFHSAMERLGILLAYEALREVPTQPHAVTTPLEAFVGSAIRGPVTIVPILRAGLAMGDAIARFVPDAQMGHIGLFRDEERLHPVHYYENLPATLARGLTLLVDPMLATGGSAMAAVDLLHQRGCRDLRFLCVVASPEGLTRLHAEHPDLPVHVVAIDRELDDRGYILPGLGDAGDRTFGTT